jgi:hypothetical protein
MGRARTWSKARHWACDSLPDVSLTDNGAIHFWLAGGELHRKSPATTTLPCDMNFSCLCQLLEWMPHKVNLCSCVHL